MLSNILKAIYLSKFENKSPLLKHISSILLTAFVSITVVVLAILFFLFLLGFTSLFGKPYFIVKIWFFVFLVGGFISSSLLFIMYKLFKKASSK